MLLTAANYISLEKRVSQFLEIICFFATTSESPREFLKARTVRCAGLCPRPGPLSFHRLCDMAGELPRCGLACPKGIRQTKANAKGRGAGTVFEKETAQGSNGSFCALFAAISAASCLPSPRATAQADAALWSRCQPHSTGSCCQTPGRAA